MTTEKIHLHSDPINNNNTFENISLLLMDSKEDEPPGISLRISNLNNVMDVNVNTKSTKSFKYHIKGDKNIKRKKNRDKKT